MYIKKHIYNNSCLLGIQIKIKTILNKKKSIYILNLKLYA